MTMEVLTDGRYKLDDGRILTQEEVIQLHKKTIKEDEVQKKGQLDLEEGQCSGPVQLND